MIDLEGRTVRIDFNAIGDITERSRLPPDAFEALAIARAASDSNASDRESGAGWRYALNSPPIYRSPNPARRSAYVLPTYDGDRPADLTDSHIAAAHTWVSEYRNRWRSPDQRALVFREAIYDRGRGDGYAASVRASHRAVHEALAGEPTTWCEWCR